MERLSKFKISAVGEGTQETETVGYGVEEQMHSKSSRTNEWDKAERQLERTGQIREHCLKGVRRQRKKRNNNEQGWKKARKERKLYKTTQTHITSRGQETTGALLLLKERSCMD